MSEDAPAAIEATNVSKWYGNVVAVNGISFTLRGGVTGLLGPNGAGKSTLLHMMAGFLRPSAGSMQVAGTPSWEHPEIYRSVGLVPEREAVYPYLTGWEFVLMSAQLQKLPDPAAAAKRAIAQVQMEFAQDRHIGGYSKGMRQRVKIAAALVHEPRILLLDEPFNGADPRQRLEMMAMLKEMARAGCTIVFSSHILEEVERLAENVLVIVAGRLAASGSFREIRRLMTDRPHTFRISSSDNRRLAAALVGDEAVFGVELQNGRLEVRASDFGAFVLAAPKVARRVGVTVFEFLPTDESLESVFAYLVKR